ncbi:MAG: NAD(P)(+) transhydrogenase (Re/Si-specific) subunit alpha, partial [Myxococcales bacterium]|nr:NAD(P)(+) transhydrogenase (Re/Si-specific) subunit alpha [Myxococcales bacterium]
MRLAVPKERAEGERRVAATPDTVRKLVKLGFEVRIEAGAGEGARYPDASYAAAGAQVVDPQAVWAEADLVLKVRPPALDEVDLLREGATLISFLYPTDNEPLLKRLAERRITALGMDQVPRISRAQKLDALSSMANIAGYKAVM